MRRRWLVLAVAAALAVPLVWALVRFMGGGLSVASWYVLWYANLLLKTIPQDAFWVLFICLAAALAVASLRGRHRARQGAHETPAALGGTVRQLALSIRRAGEAYYFRWRLAGQLSGLIVEAMGHAGEATAEPKRQWWERNSGDVPPEIRAYVEAALWGGFERPDSVGSRLRRALSAGGALSPLELDMDTVVCFLESRVEGADEWRRSKE